jgi:hypothetical protein
MLLTITTTRQPATDLGYLLHKNPAHAQTFSLNFGRAHVERCTVALLLEINTMTHLYVLVPVLDDQKHYWIGNDEVDKLLRHGKGWLEEHPEHKLIAYRYLNHRRRLVRSAIARLVAEDLGEDEEEDNVDENEEKSDQAEVVASEAEVVTSEPEAKDEQRQMLSIMSNLRHSRLGSFVTMTIVLSGVESSLQRGPSRWQSVLGIVCVFFRLVQRMLRLGHHRRWVYLHAYSRNL